jgi:hypothetical protein
VTTSIEADELGAMLGDAILGAVADWQNNSPRSQQSKARILGMSEMGGCREYIRATIAGEPKTPQEEIKWPAFVGTALGDSIEEIIGGMGFSTQEDAKLTLPRTGITVMGHLDARTKGAIVDLKSKSELATVRREGPTFKEKAQISGYLVAKVQEGVLDEDATGHLVYLDRSGRDSTTHVWSTTYQNALLILDAVEERLLDVQHALATGTREDRNGRLMTDEPRSWCESVQCFTADTEIVTRSGIRAIGSLVGTSPTLLVPVRQDSGLAGSGVWREAPVRSYGMSQVMEVALHRGRATKVVKATPSHRWFVVDSRRANSNMTSHETTTEGLRPGDRLRPIRSHSGTGVKRIPFAQAQGFVYGDGSRNYVSFHKRGGDKVRDVLPLFAGCEVHDDGNSYRVTQIPSLWKEPPDFRESASFLLSWFSGYFAADGSVSKRGQAVIVSASRESMEVVRSVCAIVGVRCSPIIAKLRKRVPLPQGGEALNHTLYSVNIRVADLPDWFFIQGQHRTRANFTIRLDDQRDWVVTSVTLVDGEQEVFCAEVPEVGAFALSDDILTGNCPFRERCWAGYAPTGELDNPRQLDAVRRLVEAREDIAAATLRRETARDDLRGVEGVVTAGPLKGTTVEWTLRELESGKVSETLNVKTPKETVA